MSLSFEQAELLCALEALDGPALDRLDFGAIGFDADTRICRYNEAESRFSGLAPSEVLGHALFTDIAQCMNNYLVAQRFEDAAQAGESLDEPLDYVLSWRMRPTPVRLRLLSAPGVATRYVLLQRRP